MTQEIKCHYEGCNEKAIAAPTLVIKSKVRKRSTQCQVQAYFCGDCQEKIKAKDLLTKEMTNSIVREYAKAGTVANLVWKSATIIWQPISTRAYAS